MRRSTNRIFTVMFIIVLFIMFVSGGMMATPGCRNILKHIQSSAIGLDRICEVYDYNGKIIKTFEGRFKIEEDNGFKTKFTLDDGRAIYISGGIIIIEER